MNKQNSRLQSHTHKKAPTRRSLKKYQSKTRSWESSCTSSTLMRRRSTLTRSKSETRTCDRNDLCVIFNLVNLLCFLYRMTVDQILKSCCCFLLIPIHVSPHIFLSLLGRIISFGMRSINSARSHPSPLNGLTPSSSSFYTLSSSTNWFRSQRPCTFLPSL